ncbi:hypothetical protein V1517DRAFT_328666 [Lipomyces orientalis]|uniref:Uncharacterized protein n=1 Tax=Lipomyces orientalis TaxID=1233043 RepID=A0ACC3THT7_9ASCO
MFRASSPTSIEEAVNKATDENLTSENWEYILEVCDKVNDSPEDGPRDAVSALQRRLAHRSANVQLYALTVANALAQNCGTKMHRELASRVFTQTLIRMATDRTVHASVKSRLLEVMEGLVKVFRHDPSLDIMADALVQVKTLNPRLHAPEKPQKPPIQRMQTTEDEELQMVLALSLQESKQNEEMAAKQQQDEEERQKMAVISEESSMINNDVTGRTAPAAPATADPASSVNRVRALYDLTTTEPGELSFRRGDVIFVLESVYQDWWKGSLRGQVGIFPLNYVTPIKEPTPEELQREAEEEAKVFAESASIERLLAMLSSPEAAENVDSTEMENLYRTAMSIRPALIKLIDKYALRKEEMVDLNNRFTAAANKYETSLNSYIRQHHSPRIPNAPASAPAQYPTSTPVDLFTASAKHPIAPSSSQTPFSSARQQQYPATTEVAHPRPNQTPYTPLIQTSFPTSSQTQLSPSALDQLTYSPPPMNTNPFPSASSDGPYPMTTNNNPYYSSVPYPPSTAASTAPNGSSATPASAFTGYPDLSFASRR